MVQSNSNCSVGSYARDSPRRNNGPAQQDRPPASAADEGAPAVRSGRPELVNDSSGLPHPIGMAEHSAGDANSIATSSIIEKVRQFEKRRRRQLEALHGPNAADVDDLTDMYLAAPEVIDDDSEPMPVPTAAIHEDKGDVMTSKKRLDVIEDDEDAPSYIGLLNDEVVESIEKHPPASSPGQVAQSQVPSPQSQTLLTAPPNQVLENNHNSSNNSDDHTQNQNQAPAPLLVRPTPQSMLPRPSSANDTTAPPIFHEVPEARVVEDDPTAPVYPATIVSDADAPWWRRHQKYTIFGLVFVSGVAMAVMGTLLATQGKSDGGILRGGIGPTESPTIILDSDVSIEEEQTKNSTIPVESTTATHGLLTNNLTNESSKEPTKEPTAIPGTNSPTRQPTKYPSKEPSNEPAKKPSSEPTKQLITVTEYPTAASTTMVPTSKPTSTPAPRSVCGSNYFDALTNCGTRNECADSSVCVAPRQCFSIPGDQCSPHYATNRPTNQPMPAPTTLRPTCKAAQNLYPSQTTISVCGSNYLDALANCSTDNRCLGCLSPKQCFSIPGDQCCQ